MSHVADFRRGASRRSTARRLVVETLEDRRLLALSSGPVFVETECVGQQEVAVGDINRDSNPDLIVADLGAKSVRIRFGDGRGGFRAGGSMTLSDTPTSLVVRDVNRDERLDVLAGTADGNVAVFLGRADGTFNSRVDYAARGAVTDFVVADFDNDRWLDIAATTNGTLGSRLQVLMSQRNGTFRRGNDYVLTSTVGATLAAGDITGDGRQDLLIAHAATNRLTPLHGRGDGSFVVSSQITDGIGVSPRDIQLTDLNRDGRLEFIVANAGSNTVSVGRGDGRGNFTVRQSAVGQKPVAVVIADENRDGILDVLTANETSDNVTILPGIGNTQFKPAKHYSAGDATRPEIFPTDLALADLNRDGFLDAIIAHANTDATLRDSRLTVLYGGR